MQMQIAGIKTRCNRTARADAFQISHASGEMPSRTPLAAPCKQLRACNLFHGACARAWKYRNAKSPQVPWRSRRPSSRSASAPPPRSTRAPRPRSRRRASSRRRCALAALPVARPSPPTSLGARQRPRGEARRLRRRVAVVNLDGRRRFADKFIEFIDAKVKPADASAVVEQAVDGHLAIPDGKVSEYAGVLKQVAYKGAARAA